MSEKPTKKDYRYKYEPLTDLDTISEGFQDYIVKNTDLNQEDINRVNYGLLLTNKQIPEKIINYLKITGMNKIELTENFSKD